VFINGQLVIDLGGIHDASTVKTVTLSQLSPALVVGQSYALDIFYAHRSSQRTPTLQLQATESALCNVINNGVASFAYTTSFPSTGIVRAGKKDIVPNLPASILRINDGSSSFAFASWQTTAQKVLNGFKTNFAYRITKSGSLPCEGIAFVFQRETTGSVGGAGENIGYEGITSSVAIEFDTKQDLANGDADGNHVSIHTRYDASNDASESFAIASAVTAPFNLADGAVHNVEIAYVPAKIDPNDPGTTTLYGWIRVYLDGNVVPIYSGQVDDRRLRSVLNGAAYLGFTAGNSGSTVSGGTIDILNWTLSIVPPSATFTSAVASPQNFIAGQSSSFGVQARDSCRNDIVVGGDLSSFAATMTQAGSPSVTPTITDNNNGIYTIGYTTTKSGVWNLGVTFQPLGGAASPIAGSPWVISVLPGPTAIQSSFTVGNGPFSAGTTYQFTITARDTYNNLRNVGGDAFQVTFSPSVTTSVVDQGNGNYAVSWTPTVATTYFVVVYLNAGGPSITGSNVQVTVGPGALSLPQSVISGTSLC